MRVSIAISLALPLLASAQQQIPFVDGAKNLLAQAQAFLSGGSNNAAKVASNAAGQAADAAGKVANAAADAAGSAARPITSYVSHAAVTDLTIDNYKETILNGGSGKPGDPAEPWFVLITGGNKTCNGLCGQLDRAWDEAATVLSADPTGPHLARVNCDKEELLCGAWSCVASHIWIFQVPHPLPDQSTPAVPLSIIRLNYTTVEAQDIIDIHKDKPYLTGETYEGAFHPFDGWLVKSGLILPLAYVLWGMSKVPSWAFMIGLSLFSRYFVSKRMPNGAPPFARPAPAGGPAAAAKKNK